ncbi:hypothetical protein BHE97_08750 [Aeromicrobium sp. PE09-221]|uniref:LLM class flavin-dependent oxidoreductase n=1 Tax=Aeromicrobium sp. PE09-221 TaxID=1898043 RepID=UPI000B3EBE42|nr:LLM class flavin-dependent oxidoreductase [Aeromicrobium sp. PE09-221]OUZ10134.1 hypothetical protein BHE97_08750 [Aeromicrobium sp. PE09-221]
MTTDTTFGFGMVTAQRHPDDPRTDTEIYADTIDLCAYAEDLGFDAVWLSEHHFVDDGYMPSLLPVAAAVAMRTSRVRIGTGIMVAPLHDPLRLAEDAATVDLLSAGRLVLGIGAGYRDEEFAGFGKPKERLGAALDRTLDVLRDAWGPGVVEADEHTAPVSVTPKPHRPGGPPIWIGARTSGGIRRTARRADGLLAARVSPEELREQVSSLLTMAHEAGREPGDLEVGVHTPVFAWPHDAWDRIEPYIHYSEWKYKDMGGTPYGQRDGDRARPPAISPRTREILRSTALVGTPEEVAAGVRRYRDAVEGVPFHFIPRLYWPGMPPALQREAMACFAEHVLPLV